jgi:hypothetical protein
MNLVTLLSKRFAILMCAIVECCAPSAMCAAPATMSPPNIVRQIDHVLLTSSKANELFELLTETLQLPAVWPLSNYGSFGSGGVALGNVNLEIIKRPAAAAGAASGGFVGLALEPESLRSSLAELDARGISHGAPAPFRSLWTTVALPEVSSDALEIFLCDYTHDVAERRHRFLAQLQSRGGGPLSLHSVREVVIGARDVKRTEAQWQKFLHPVHASADGAWPIGAGPAVRVVQAEHDEIQTVIVAVISLEQARRFLKQHDLLGADQPAALSLASSRFPGFNLTLVEQPAERR